MIAAPLTRRSVVIGGLVGTATLTGCSVADLTTRKVEDPQATDRSRIAQAIALSSALRSDIDATPPSGRGELAVGLRVFGALHQAQITVFARTSGLTSPVTSKSLDMRRTVTAASLRAREADLARTLRALALEASDGEVAALLASAAAGIDQALTR